MILDMVDILRKGILILCNDIQQFQVKVHPLLLVTRRRQGGKTISKGVAADRRLENFGW